jgi:sulfur carrier protein
MIKLTVNGKEESAPDGATLKTLLETLAVPASGVVAAVNGAVVKPAGFSAAVLHDGDTVDLVRFVGGG